jgi:hypothetical protein
MTTSLALDKVIYCIDEVGLGGETGEWLLTSVLSARRNTSLRPVVLYCGPDVRDCINFIGADVTVIAARSRLHKAIAGLDDEARSLPDHAEGALLRYEIPSLFPDDEYLLYIDCDTVFFDALPSLEPFAAVAAAVPTSFNDDGPHYNSGVLVINVGAFLREERAFFSFLERTLGNWPGSVDEMAFNEFFRGRLYTLPPYFNWRARWDYRKDVPLFHFHGFKFALIRFLNGDVRGFPGKLENYIYELAVEYGRAAKNVLAYMTDMERTDLFATEWIREQFDALKLAMDRDALVQRHLFAVAQLAGAASAGLALAPLVISSRSDRALHTVWFDGSGPNVKWLRIHPCTRIGAGSLEFHHSGDAGIQLRVTPNPMIALGIPEQMQAVWKVPWSGVGLDCHVIVEAADGEALPKPGKLVIRSLPVTRCLVVGVLMDGTETVLYDSAKA